MLQSSLDFAFGIHLLEEGAVCVPIVDIDQLVYNPEIIRVIFDPFQSGNVAQDADFATISFFTLKIIFIEIILLDNLERPNIRKNDTIFADLSDVDTLVYRYIFVFNLERLLFH